MILNDLTKEYQVFLFDFDGLLADTEHVHFEAFKELLKRWKYDLDWQFRDYVNAAHFSTTGLKDTILKKFPDLEEKVGPWKEWYSKKNAIYIELLGKGVQLLPGAKELLDHLKEANIKRAVVTHSPKNLVDIIKAQHECLQSIPNWYTRELYTKAKPDPECYDYAMDKLCEEGEKAIGFEDSPRGVKALLNSRAKPVWVGPEDYPGKDVIKDERILHLSSLSDLF
jgi:beta-phosphoglucomutase